MTKVSARLAGAVPHYVNAHFFRVDVHCEWTICSEISLGLARYQGARFRRNFLHYAVSLWGSQHRSKMLLVSKLLKDFANFRAWREAQSSISIQEGPQRVPWTLSEKIGSA